MYQMNRSSRLLNISLSAVKFVTNSMERFGDGSHNALITIFKQNINITHGYAVILAARKW
jgi:hypothetical protein